MATRTINNTGASPLTWSNTNAWVEGAVPTASDDVVATSGSLSINMTANATCRSIDLSAGPSTSTLTQSASTTLSVGTSTANGSLALKFSSTGMKYVAAANTATVTFASTSSTQLGITTGGYTLGQLTFSGSGGSWQFLDAVTLSGSSFNIQSIGSGAVDLNGQTLTFTVGANGTFNISGGTLALGAATINFNNSGGTFGSTTGTPTIVANTATVNIKTNNAANNPGRIPTGTFKGGNINWNGLTAVMDASSQAGGFASITGTPTLGALTIKGGNGAGAAADSGCSFAGNTTITGALTLTGFNSTNSRLYVGSATIGTQVTVSAGSVTAANCDFEDISGAGSANWDLHAITGNSGDCGGNAGITFTAPATQTLSSTGTQNWSVATWTSRQPLPQDDVVIGAISNILTGDVPRLGKSIDFTGYTQTFHFSTQNFCRVFGSLTFSSGMTLSNGNVTLSGRSTYTLTTSGNTLSGSQGIIIQAPNGTYSLADDLVLANATTAGISSTVSLQVVTGTFNTNNHTMTLPRFLAASPIGSATLNLGTSTINVCSTNLAQTFQMGTTAAGATVSAASATIIIRGATANQRFVSGGQHTYGTLTYTVAGSTGALKLDGGNTWDTINFSDTTSARTLMLTAGTTETVRVFNVFGTAGVLMTLASATASSNATIAFTGADPCTDYLQVTDCTATGLTAHAGTHSTLTRTVNWVAASCSTAYTATESETLSTTDTVARLFSAARSQSELLNVVDAVVRVAAFAKVLTDGTPTNDALARTEASLRLTLEDQLTGDVTAASQTLSRMLAETSAAIDSLVVTPGLSRSLSESLAVADALVKGLIFSRPIDEALATTSDILRVVRIPTRDIVVLITESPRAWLANELAPGWSAAERKAWLVGAPATGWDATELESAWKIKEL